MNNKEDVYILAIESSCDETAAAISKNGLTILANVVASQIDWHREFGGVVPELASRKHLEFINPVISQALQEADLQWEDIDAIAVTYGPGLVGSLLVGITAAKTLSYLMEKPLIGVNHILGHIYANFISHQELETPVVCLTVSGGHTDLLYFKDLQGYEILGRSRDDAAGEAFDKVARFLKLGYPGGPHIEKIARQGDPQAVEFPRAEFKDDSLDFSFSGLKTAVINYVHNLRQQNKEINRADLAASFQQAVIDMLNKNILQAVEKHDVKNVVLAGGVAANGEFRRQLQEKLQAKNKGLYYPPLKYCTDNAAMIAAVAYFQYLKQDFKPLTLQPEPGLKL